MKTELIGRILDGVAGLRRDGAGHRVPEEIDLSVFVALPSEVLTVPRCSRIEITGETIAIETHKGERYWFAVQDVAGLRSNGTERRPAALQGAGFR